jgi:hypothetical protein
MKNRFISAACALALLSAATPTRADEGVAMVVDAVLVRPVTLASTVIGAAFWVVALPVTIPSKSVKKTGKVLVERPAKATFTRPLGDMFSLQHS